ncbi:hypothetical protein [Alsobacter sp. SYSU BS001988]|jgi:hypothetical protein
MRTQDARNAVGVEGAVFSRGVGDGGDFPSNIAFAKESFLGSSIEPA